MLAIDTNILFHAYHDGSQRHKKAYDWVDEIGGREDIVISEFVLVELYRLLRNPAVMDKPCSPPIAVAAIESYRTHPRWRIAGFPTQSRELHDELYQRMSRPNIAYRRIYDTRLALSLQAAGVTEFATTNLKNFQGFGFTKVWNPLA
ncbi:MAG: TA system VapC family ribonuclease toxin [Chthoniobacterales bacterium]